MKSTRISIRIFLTLSLLFALNAQAQTPDEAESCYKTYVEAKGYSEIFVPDIFGTSLLPEDPLDTLEGDYDLRLYRAGEVLDQKLRRKITTDWDDRFLETLDIVSELFNKVWFEPSPDHIPKFNKDRRNRVQKCDVLFKIPPATRKIYRKDIVRHQECIVRYATLYSSFTIPRQKQYFNQRAQLAMSVASAVRNVQAYTPEHKKIAAADGVTRAKQSFNADGSPKFEEMHKSFRDVQSCDVKYGLPVTSIPPAVHQGATGKSGGKK